MAFRMTVRSLSIPDSDRWLGALTTTSSFLSNRFPTAVQDVEALSARVDRVKARFPKTERLPLCEALAAGLSAHGAGTAAVQAAQSLADPETLCLVTGQQPGVLLSPFYSVVKAAGTVAQARCLGRELGRNVVPVFWTATEDHDVGEVERARLMATRGEDGEMDAHLWQPIPRGRFPVGGLDIRDALARMLCRIETAPALPGVFRSDALALAHDLIGSHPTLGGHFMALMNRVFDGTPLVVLDPMDPSLRALAAPMFSRLLREGRAVADAVRAGSENLLAASGEAGVQAPWREGESGVFYLVEGQRAMLEREGFTPEGPNGDRGPMPEADERLLPRGRPDLARRRGEWAEEALEHPERFSSDVHLRPLIQESLLPVIGVVLGPGETRYWAQLTELFSAMDLEMPAALPRARVTLVPPHVQSLLGKLSLSVEAVVSDWQGGLERTLAERDRIGIVGRFEKYEEDLRGLHAALMADLEPLGKDFARHGPPNLARHLEAVSWLRAKALKSHREGNDTLIRRFKTVGNYLAPQGQPQDRYWSAFTFLAQEGINLGTRLAMQDELAGPGLLGVWTGAHEAEVGVGDPALCSTR